MRRVAGFLLWSCLFIVLLLAADQLFLRVPMPLPVLGEVRTFYIDFRQRLLQLPHSSPGAAPKAAAPRTAKPGARPAPPPRFVYVDDQGNLQFAGSLDEVPAHLRRDVRPLQP